MSKHTDEDLVRLDPKNAGEILVNGEPMMVMGDHGSQIEENARRFVACYRACRNIPTEALEQNAVADMLEALERAEKTVGMLVHNSDFHSLLNLPSVTEVYEKMCTSIAKVKQQNLPEPNAEIEPTL